MDSRIEALRQKKGREKIAALTAYDYATAALCDGARLDFILVGDSLGVVVLGYENPLPVTMQDMVHHTKAVARGAKSTLVIGDMPANTHSTPAAAAKNARLFLKAGAHAVKTEGCNVKVTKALIKNGIAVMGHIGLTPQTISEYKVQGREEKEAKRILGEARQLDEAGVFALVIECIPESLAKLITETISAPTIGIGAGRYCDGQILVLHDMLGFFDRYVPKFAKQYLNLRAEIKEAIEKYKSDVRGGAFPGEENVYR